MNRRQKIIVSVTGIFIVLLILIGLTYGYFLTRITGNGNPNSISVTTANLELVYGDGTTAILTSETPLMPSSTPIGTKDFTVTNNGDDSEYVVVFEDIAVKYAADTVIDGQTVSAGTETSFESNDFVYTLTCTKKDGASCEGVQESFPMSGGVVVFNKIKKGDVHNYILTLYYLDNGFDQSADMNKTLNGKVNIYDKKLYFRNLSEIASTVLSQLSSDYIPSSNRAIIEPFFYIPIDSNSIINVQNNSENFSIAVHCIDSRYISTKDSGWINPQTSKVIETNDAIYLRIYFKDNNSSEIDINSIDLSNFIITYSNSQNNMIEELSILEYAYNNYSLRNYNANDINTYVNNIDIAAHAGASDDEDLKSTMTAIKNAVEVENFENVEIDLRVSKDNEFVLYHDESIVGMEQTIVNSTFEELKAYKSNLTNLEEALAYLSTNNIGVILDVKAFPNSKEVADKLFRLIETYNMQNNFRFSRCVPNLLKNIPEEYKNIPYSSYQEDWNESNTGKNVYYSRPVGEINLKEFVNLLKAGHKKFEMYDMPSSFTTLIIKNTRSVALCAYLCERYGADLNMTFYENVEFDLLNITEEQMLKYVPKDIWDASNLLQRN